MSASKPPSPLRTLASAWGNEDTQQLIDILAKYNVKATFFVVGDWVDRYPESVKALSNAGHEVMNHSNDHAHFNALSSNQMMQDVNTCNQKIEAITKVRPTLFRPPYGEYNDLVVSTVRSMGMEPIQWDVDGYARASIPCSARTRKRFPPYIPSPLHILSINGMALNARQKGGV